MTSTLHPVPLALALALLGHAPTMHAQEDRDAPPPVARADAPTLGEVTVSASALGLRSSEMLLPFSVLTGDQLLRQREATLGETLMREPGVRATHFGAGASRPIIRGLDGPRVRILSDGAEVSDASAISPDHAVAFEPMLARQIEVLRGPAALAHEGGASGGVVNVLDHRVPTEVPSAPTGAIEVRAGSGAREATGAFEVTAGSGNFAVHAEGLKRDARDYRVGSGWSEGRTVEGSYNQSQTGSLGASWIGQRGYIGLAYTDQRNEYGLPGHGHDFEECHAHDDHLDCGEHGHDEDEHEDEPAAVPTLQLRSERWDVRGEYLEPLPGFSRLAVRASHTDYRHDEIEDGARATRFTNKAHNGRVELEHEAVAGWRGVIGVQTSRRDFSAVGEEAYLQPTRTRRHGVFMVEEQQFGDWRIEAGVRHERQHVDISTDQRDRSHRGTSVSLGANWAFAPGYLAGLSFSRSQRLPSAEELYADGLHLATRTLERGNPDLRKETAHNVDLSLRKLSGSTTFSVSAFRNRIDDYIYARTLDEHEGLQLIEYAQRDAVFTGIEGQIRQRINPIFGVTLFGDYVRARLTQSDDTRYLPRIPAHRLGVRLDAQHNAWGGEIEWYRVARQSKVARFEDTTSSYHMLNLGVTYHGRSSATPFELYLKANNLTNELAFNHSSFIKDAAPLMGRNLTAGARVSF